MRKDEEGEALFSDKYQGERILICIRMHNNWTNCIATLRVIKTVKCKSQLLPEAAVGSKFIKLNIKNKYYDQ